MNRGSGDFVSRRNATLLGLLAALALAAAYPAPSVAAPYLFTEVARTDAAHSDRVTGPALNNAGMVAFRHVAGEVEGIYTTATAGGPLVPVVTTAAGEFSRFGPAPDLNDLGAVAFQAFAPDGGEGIYVAAVGGAVVPVARTGAEFSRFSTGRLGPPGVAFPAINNSGVVAVAARRRAAPRDALLRYRDGTLEVVTEAAAVTQPDLNSHGDIVYYAEPMSAIDQAIYLADAQGIRRIELVIAHDVTLTQSPTLNDKGVLAFGYAYGAWAVILKDGTSDRRFLGVNRPTGGGGFSLNDRDVLAYITEGDYPWYEPYIVAGPPEALGRVIGVGDSLLGSRVTALSYSREGFNDAGQLAFWAALADGRRVIVLATPVPEPTAAGLLVLALVLLSRTRFGAMTGGRAPVPRGNPASGR